MSLVKHDRALHQTIISHTSTNSSSSRNNNKESHGAHERGAKPNRCCLLISIRNFPGYKWVEQGVESRGKAGGGKQGMQWGFKMDGGAGKEARICGENIGGNGGRMVSHIYNDGEAGL